MAKAAIPRRILFFLLIAALFAAGAFLSQKPAPSNPGDPDPPRENPDKLPSRPDAALWEKWKGKAMPEILAALVPSAPVANPPPLDPAPDPPGIEIDPYLPRFEPVAGLTLPPAEDAAALYGHLILSSSGSPLSVWRVTADHAEDVTAASGLEGIPGGKRCLPADFDRDGDLDLFIGRGGDAPDSLLRRTGEKTFEDVTESFGLLEFLDIADAAWVDFDRDGWLDLCVLQKTAGGSAIRLFHNQSGSAFANAGLAVTLPAGTNTLLWRDVDDDGFTDLVLSGDKPRVFQNAAGCATFHDITPQIGLPENPGGPVTAADFDGDGRTDLAIAAEGTLTLMIGGPEFTKIDLPGVAAPVAILATDFDRDGIPDLAVSGVKGETRAWWNAGNAEFREILGAAGLSATAPAQRFVVFDPADAGSPGILICGGRDRLSSFRKAESSLAGDRARVALRLTAPEGANRNGLDARVTFSIRDRRFIYSTRSIVVESPTEIVGLGEAATIEAIEIVWPDRARTVTQLARQPVNSLIEAGPDAATVRVTPLNP